jgi:hypothetical protein
VSTSQEKAVRKNAGDSIDRNAPAGSENSLGAQSVRDGRPAADDSVVEAIDEEGPGIDTQPATEATADKKKQNP